MYIYIYVYIIDQAPGQDGWLLAEFSFCVFMDRDEVEVHKNVKRERLAILFFTFPFALLVMVLSALHLLTTL